MLQAVPQHQHIEVQVRLEVELELMVGIIKRVDPNVTVLSAAGVALAVGVEGERVDGTEVALHPAKLLLKHQVEESEIIMCEGT